MRSWRQNVLVVLLVIVTVACGHATPATGERVLPLGGSDAATPATSAMPLIGTPARATPSASPTPVASTGPIRTSEEAAARALAIERANPLAEHSSVVGVQWMTLGEAWAAEGYGPGVGDPDPNLVIWWVDLSGTFRIFSCPAPGPCGTSSHAVVELAAADGYQIGGFLGSRRFPATPTAVSRQIPADARLKTPGQAIDAGFREVPGKNGKQATLVNLRLLTLQQWLDERAAQGARLNLPLASSTPMWELEFRDANFTPPCSILGGCHIEHVVVALDAITGNGLGWYGPVMSTPVSPGASDAAPEANGQPLDALAHQAPEMLYSDSASE